MFREQTGNVVACGIIIAVLISLGVFCVHLNQLFYLRYGPFWDSVSYDDLLARVMLSVRAGEPITGFALIYSSTVALPWLQAMILAPFVEPSRAIAVWIQVSWMVVTALSAYVYFRQVVGYGKVTAICCALMLFLISCTFNWNGGLSDFRLDYLQYTQFGLACLLYFLAKADGRLGAWTLWGVALGLACLSRATTLVYAALVFGPFCLVDIWSERRALRAVILRYGLGFSYCFLVCGWYFISNISRLYFYYFLWNWNALARLPISISKQYAILTFDNVGPVAAGGCLAIFCVAVGASMLGGGSGKWSLRQLWCGVAPLAYLIGSGSGLSQAISEIAVFGFLLFALAPRAMVGPSRVTRLRAVVAVIAVILTAVFGVSDGIRNHTDETGQYVTATYVPRRAVVSAVTHCITDDMALNSAGKMTYTMLYSGLLNSEVITNSLLFDERLPAEVLPNGLLALEVGPAKLTMSPFRVDRVVTPVQWDMMEGEDDEQKVRNIAQEVAAEADYVIAPAGDAILPNGTIDIYARRIEASLATLVSLRPLCQNVQIGPEEFATIYRSASRR